MGRAQRRAIHYDTIHLTLSRSLSLAFSLSYIIGHAHTRDSDRHNFQVRASQFILISNYRRRCSIRVIRVFDSRSLIFSRVYATRTNAQAYSSTYPPIFSLSLSLCRSYSLSSSFPLVSSGLLFSILGTLHTQEKRRESRRR